VTQQGDLFFDEPCLLYHEMYRYHNSSNNKKIRVGVRPHACLPDVVDSWDEISKLLHRHRKDDAKCV
jgi:hypothetical protein